MENERKRRKISEENIFTKDHVKILKEIITSFTHHINEINSDSQLTAEQKLEKIKPIKNEIEKANEILKNQELTESYVAYCTRRDIEFLASGLFGTYGAGLIKKSPIFFNFGNIEKKIRDVAWEFEIDEKDLTEFLKNKNTLTVIEELYQNAGYKIIESRISDNGDYSIPAVAHDPSKIYYYITQFKEGLVPEKISQKSKGL